MFTSMKYYLTDATIHLVFISEWSTRGLRFTKRYCDRWADRERMGYWWPQQDISNLGIDLGHWVDWSGLFLFQSLYVLATVTIRNIWRKLRGKYWRVKDQQDTWEQTVLISVSVPQDSIVMSSSLFPLFLLLSPVFLPPVLSSPLQLVDCQCSSAATARVGVGSSHWSGVWHTLCTHWLGSQSETLLAFRLFFMV